LQYDKPDPVNVGSGQEISIRDLVELITEYTGYCGDIIWDSSQPDGQPRRLLDVSKARIEFQWQATTKFTDGLRKTIDWYEISRSA
jgi:GDP-L-fucose synthase